MPTPTMASATGQVAMRPRPMTEMTPRSVLWIRCTPRPKAPSNSGWMIATMVMSREARAGPGKIATASQGAMPVKVPAITA